MQFDGAVPSSRSVRFVDRVFVWMERGAPNAWAWLILPVLLHSWTLTAPFLFDDLHLLLKAERWLAEPKGAPHLFEFADSEASYRALIERGTIAWWSPPIARLAFFRPVAEWSFVADTLLFGRHAVFHRLVSLLWFALALIAIHRMFRAAGADPIRAGAATFLFGISQSVAGPVDFISNRSELIAVVFTALAATCYWSQLRKTSILRALLSLGAFAVALLAKEIALPLAGVLFLHAFVFARRDRDGPGLGAARGVAFGMLVLALVYSGYYVTSYAARGEKLDVADGAALLASLPLVIGQYLTVWTTGFPVGILWQWASTAQVLMAALIGAALATIAVPIIVRSVRGDPAGRFFALWTALFFLPPLITVVEARALCLATVGWAYLIATVILPRESSSYVPPAIARHWLLTVNGLFAIVATICGTGVAIYAEESARGRLLASVAREPGLRAGQTLVIAAADNGSEVPFAADRVEVLTGLKGIAVAFLTHAADNVRFNRIDDRTILARADAPGLMAGPLHRLALGPRWEPKPGARFRARDFEAELVGVDNGAVTAIQFRFDRSLDDPRLRFDPPDLIRRIDGAAARTSESGG